MAKKYAYMTTTARTAEVSGIKDNYDNIVAPEGDDWEFLGTSATVNTRFFEWRRLLPETSSKK